MTDWTTAYKSKAPPWSPRLLLAASLLLPLLVAGLFAWRDYARTMAEAEVAVERAGALAQEHALKVVETATLVLERIWEACSSPCEYGATLHMRFGQVRFAFCCVMSRCSYGRQPTAPCAQSWVAPAVGSRGGADLRTLRAALRALAAVC